MHDAKHIGADGDACHGPAPSATFSASPIRHLLLPSKLQRRARSHWLFCEQVPEIGIAWRLGRVGVRLGESVAEQGVELAHKAARRGSRGGEVRTSKGACASCSAIPSSAACSISRPQTN